MQVNNNNDFILIKQIFKLILQKCDYTTKKLYDEYHKIIGKVHFSINRLNFVYTTEIADDLCVLELFFKNYILLENIIQEVKDKTKRNPEDIKIQLPFDIKAYRLEKKYPKRTIKIIKDLFSKKRELIIPDFKMVLTSELNRLNVSFKGLLINFTYNNSEKYIEKLRNNGFYFDNLKDLYDDKLEPFRRATSNGKINKFVIFKGNSIITKKNIDLDWSIEFKVRDIHYQQIACKITHNRTYFYALPLDMESEIELQGIIRVKYSYNKKTKIRKIVDKYIEIIDIKIIDNFKVVSYNLGNRYSEENWLENTREGLSKFTYKEKHGRTEQISQIKILRNPLILLNVFKGKNERFYEIKIKGEILCKPKKQIIDELDKMNQIINKNMVDSAVSQILEESIKVYDLKIKPMYNTVGIFLSKENEFILVYEDDENQRIIGENDVQLSLLKAIRAKELDREGDLTESYFRIINNPTLSQNVRLSLLGWSASHPFFYAISNKITFLPPLFLIGPHGTGKSTSLENLMNYLYGTKMKNPDKVKTDARITKFLTESPFAVNIDDMKGVPPDQIAMLKSYAVKRDTRDRMDGQNMLEEQMYASICGSSNSNEFLKDDPAFRIRCIIHYINKRISHKSNKELLIEFYKHQAIIVDSNKIFGFYFLNKALEYLNNIEGDITLFQKFIDLYNQTYDKIDNIIDKKDIVLSDIRRIKLYSLMYIGWIFWDYCLQTKGFKSDLLTNALNFESDTFSNYINELEEAEKEINLEIFESILEFFRQNEHTYSTYRRVSRDQNLDKKIVITAKFIVEYDKWATQRRYNTLNSMREFAELESTLLNRDIRVKPMRYQDSEGKKHDGKAVIFYYKESLALRGERINRQEIDDYETYAMIDMDRIFIEKPNRVNKLETLRDRLNEIFEDNNWKSIEKVNIVQILELEEDLDKKFIESALEEMIREGTFYEPKKGFINKTSK